MIEFNIQSNDHLSLLFFGGELKDFETVPCLDVDGKLVLIKSGPNIGSVKLKKQETIFKIEGLGVKPQDKWKLKKPGFYSTKEDVLIEIRDGTNAEAAELARSLLTIRGLNKEIATYYNSTEKELDKNNLVHPNFNHTETDTARLSSSKINAQNQPKPPSKIRAHFISRFDDGVLVCGDYSQLEICVQAQLSMDRQYLQDIIDGIDFHCKRLALKEKMSYTRVYKLVKQDKDDVWIAKRSKIKEFSFQRSYGAGAFSIALNTGLTVDEVKELIRCEELEYATLKRYNDWLIAAVNRNLVFIEGEAYGWYASFTGRRYYFKQIEAQAWQKEKGVLKSFLPTQIKNYIIQGTATGDIVLIMLGLFWREIIKHRDTFLLINTVHDSIILDCHREYVELAEALMQNILTKVKKMCLLHFQYDWIAPINIDIKVGLSWYECGI